MHFQLALLQPSRDRREQSLRLGMASAMDHRIIGETGKQTLRVLPLHPSIEGDARDEP